MLIVEQNVLALDLADRAYVLKKGQVVDTAVGTSRTGDAGPPARRLLGKVTRMSWASSRSSLAACSLPPPLSSLSASAIAVNEPEASPCRSSSRNRLLAGLGCFAAAGIVAIIGYLKISIEPEINRQIPYLASAGMLLVILVVLGDPCSSESSYGPTPSASTSSKRPFPVSPPKSNHSSSVPPAASGRLLREPPNSPD